jgi:YgiT-type zinc finger domain-containing protein
MTCFACKSKNIQRQTVELVTRVGAYSVTDRTVTVPVCQACGEYVIPGPTHELVELRAALVALADAPAVSGDMLRFARKALGLTQAELAERIGSTFESVSRWEREERPMEPWVPLTMLALLRERLMPAPSGVKLRRAG